MAYQEKWGREKARERYGSEGMKKFADGGEVAPKEPTKPSPPPITRPPRRIPGPGGYQGGFPNNPRASGGKVK